MIDLKVEIQDKELQQYLKKIAGKAEKRRVLLKRFGIIMLRSFAQNFKDEGRPRHWKRLSPNTIAARRRGGDRRYGSKKILQDSGRLRLSVTSKSGPGNIYQMSEDSLKMGSRLKIATFHQDGTRPYTIRPKRSKMLSFMTTEGRRFAGKVNHPGLPARPFIMIQDDDERSMLDETVRYLEIR